MTDTVARDRSRGVSRNATPGVAVVLGTRPEIIKLAPVVHECRRRDVPVTVIHTGQHYSEALDTVFFEQLDLPAPDYNLGVGSNSHGAQTGEMLAGVERILLEHRPAAVLVQGDTNSTLSGALAAAKLSIPVGHVEAGLRSFDREMPEEINRVVVDHVADYLFAPTAETATLLEAEGIDPDAITVVGNTVVDALRFAADRAAGESTVLAELGLTAGEFCLMTAHRAENVDDPDRFARLLAAVGGVAEDTGLEVIYPIHPRAAARLESFGLAVPAGVRLVEPLAFLDFLRLEDTAALVVTDSGGVQEEACVLGTPCVTLRYSTERPETAYVGANMIAGLDPDDVREAARRMLGKPATWANPFGDGTAAARILDALEPALAAARETEPTPTTSVGSETDPTDDADVLDRDAESDAHTHTTTRPSVRGS
jgi:UDP-N-acetylglucosamine 2-epimerase (non-hydrolysing)